MTVAMMGMTGYYLHESFLKNYTFHRSDGTRKGLATCCTRFRGYVVKEEKWVGRGRWYEED